MRPCSGLRDCTWCSFSMRVHIRFIRIACHVMYHNVFIHQCSSIRTASEATFLLRAHGQTGRECSSNKKAKHRVSLATTMVLVQRPMGFLTRLGAVASNLAIATFGKGLVLDRNPFAICAQTPKIIKTTPFHQSRGGGISSRGRAAAGRERNTGCRLPCRCRIWESLFTPTCQ